MSEKDDNGLIQRYLAGNPAAFDLLLSRYLKLIYSVAFYYVKNSDDAQDITQEAVVKIWKSLARFKPDQSFKPWAMRIVCNAALDWLKKKKPVAFSALEQDEAARLAESVPDVVVPFDVRLERLELARAVQSAVNMLPKEDRMIMHLRYELELTYREIGELVGKALDTVKSRHARAVLKLKSLIDPNKL